MTKCTRSKSTRGTAGYLLGNDMCSNDRWQTLAAGSAVRYTADVYGELPQIRQSPRGLGQRTVCKPLLLIANLIWKDLCITINERKTLNS